MVDDRIWLGRERAADVSAPGWYLTQNAVTKIRQKKSMRVARFVDAPAISHILTEVNCRRVTYGDAGGHFYAPPRRVD